MTKFKEVEKMTAADLFGLVGGQLGLFVGVSLVTIFEFMEFGADLLKDKILGGKDSGNGEK